MRKLSILLALVAGLYTFPANADFTGKDASAATITFKNPGTCTAVVCVPVAQLYDGTNVVTLTTAGADGASNTLTGVPVYSRNVLYNGTTWDRWLGDTTNGGWVNVKTSVLPTGAATSANQTSELTKLDSIITNTGTAIPAGSAIIGKVGIDQTTPGTTNGVQVNAALPAGTNTIGNVGSDPSSGKGTPSSVAINVSTATTTQLVAISGSTSIYVTSFDVIAGGTGNITFEYGTGSNCGTGTTALTGAYNLTAQAGIAKGNGLGTILKVPSGNALCVLTSAAVQMSGSVSYQQF